MSGLDDYIANDPTSPFRDPVAGETGYIDPTTMRAFAQTIADAVKAATVVGQAFSFTWTPTAPPGTGKITIDQWAAGALKLLLSETTADGEALSFAALDNATGAARVRVLTADGDDLHADVVGPSVDMGNYREVPIGVTNVVAGPPSNNEKITLMVVAEAG